MNFDMRIDPEEMIKYAKKNTLKYQNNLPYPHIVIDDFFDESDLTGILDEFPDKNDIDWMKFSEKNSIKLASKDENQLGLKTFHLVNVLNSGSFLKFLENLTGIKGLISDPYLFGGGLHSIHNGGYLRVHADYNKHNTLPLERRVNVLLYLNKNWKDSFNGNLELWNEDMTHCVKEIQPLFNRMVVFNTDSTSYHGHPKKVSCPSNRSRKSLALYFFTVQNAAEPRLEHSTLYMDRPSDRVWTVIENIVKSFIPPIVVSILKKFRKVMKKS